MICANPKCGKEFEQLRKDKIYCSAACYMVIYKDKNRERDRKKVNAYKRAVRKRKAKPKSSSLYKHCNFCGVEHMRTSENFYIYQLKGNNHSSFHCKKESNYKASLIPVERQRIAKSTYKKRNPQAKRDNQNRQTERLTDGYIKRRLLKMGGKDVPNELIQLKRTHITLKRKMYGKSNPTPQPECTSPQ